MESKRVSDKLKCHKSILSQLQIQQMNSRITQKAFDRYFLLSILKFSGHSQQNTNEITLVKVVCNLIKLHSAVDVSQLTFQNSSKLLLEVTIVGEDASKYCTF